MRIETENLWESTPGLCEEIPKITAYIPDDKKSDAAIVIFPGGGYAMRADYEGEGYAKFLAENGYTAFSVDYRVLPHRFPLPVLDGRRAVRFVRYNAEKYGIDKKKIAVMGSSAGAHLAATLSNYYEPIDFEGTDSVDSEDFVPNAQILCYPVISLCDEKIMEKGSANNLLGELWTDKKDGLSPEQTVSERTPKAFIWHTFNDNIVNVKNSLVYADRLKDFGIAAEMHIFPEGEHGLGLANGDDRIKKHVSQWSKLLLNWLEYNF